MPEARRQLQLYRRQSQKSIVSATLCKSRNNYQSAGLGHLVPSDPSDYTIWFDIRLGKYRHWAIPSAEAGLVLTGGILFGLLVQTKHWSGGIWTAVNHRSSVEEWMYHTACPLRAPGHDSSAGEWMYLTACLRHGSGWIPGCGGLFQGIFFLADHKKFPYDATWETLSPRLSNPISAPLLTVRAERNFQHLSWNRFISASESRAEHSTFILKSLHLCKWEQSGTSNIYPEIASSLQVRADFTPKARFYGYKLKCVIRMS